LVDEDDLHPELQQQRQFASDPEAVDRTGVPIYGGPDAQEFLVI
jgi:hypothetical protein